MSGSQHALTEAELDTLQGLMNRQDSQGVKDFFAAMPQDKREAVIFQMLAGYALIRIASEVVEFARTVLNTDPA